MSWDARFIAMEGELPTENEMILSGVYIKEIENSKFYYVEYKDKEGNVHKSGFWISGVGTNDWYGTVSYANRVEYFGKWLWDNFKVLYYDDTDEPKISFEEKVWDKLTEEEKTKVQNYNLYYLILYNGVADENDEYLKKIYVPYEEIKIITDKYEEN